MTNSLNQRRANLLKVLHMDPATKALAAEVPMGDLLDFLAEMRSLGLIDAYERTTVAGAVFRTVVGDAEALIAAGSPSFAKAKVNYRDTWRKVGGDEKLIDAAFAVLVKHELLREYNADEGAAREFTVGG